MIKRARRLRWLRGFENSELLKLYKYIIFDYKWWYSYLNCHINLEILEWHQSLLKM